MTGGGEPTHLRRRRPAKVRAGRVGQRGLVVQALLVAVQPITPPRIVPSDAVVIAIVVAIAVIVIGVERIAVDYDRAAVVAAVMASAAVVAMVAIMVDRTA